MTWVPTSKELYAHVYHLVDWLMSHSCLHAFAPKVALRLFLSLLVIAFLPNSIRFPQSYTHPLLSSNSFICIYLTTWFVALFAWHKPKSCDWCRGIVLNGPWGTFKWSTQANQLCDCLIHVTPDPISGKNLHVQHENNFNDVATNLKAQRIEGIGIYAWSKVSRPNNIFVATHSITRS